jgi:hypothetical protein
MTMTIAEHDLRLNKLQAPENTGHTNPPGVIYLCLYKLLLYEVAS